MITVEYRFDSDDMTDEEYGNQDEQKFVITKEMIIEILRENVEKPKDHEICSDNIYVRTK